MDPSVNVVRGWVTQSDGIVVIPMLMGLILSVFPGQTILEVMAAEDSIIRAPVQPEQVGTRSVK